MYDPQKKNVKKNRGHFFLTFIHMHLQIIIIYLHTLIHVLNAISIL